MFSVHTNSRVLMETMDTAAPRRGAFHQPTTLFQRHRLSVGRFLRAVNTGATIVTKVCFKPPTNECRPHHGTILEQCLPSIISDDNHQPAQAHQDFNVTGTQGSLLPSPYHTPRVSVFRCWRTGPYVNVMSAKYGQEIPAEFLRSHHPNSSNF